MIIKIKDEALTSLVRLLLILEQSKVLTENITWKDMGDKIIIDLIETEKEDLQVTFPFDWELS